MISLAKMYLHCFSVGNWCTEMRMYGSAESQIALVCESKDSEACGHISVREVTDAS